MRGFVTLQQIGKSFMLPIALLPAAGILLGIGGAFTNVTMISAYHLEAFLGAGTLLNHILSILRDSGNIVFVNLPLLFAIGIAVGMAKTDKGTAGLAAAIGFVILHQTISSILAVSDINEQTTSMAFLVERGMNEINAIAESQKYTHTLGIFTLQMSVFGGIISGLITAYLHNRFCTIELPAVFGFFGGSRFVPIITAFSMIILAACLCLLWPPIQNQIEVISKLISGLGVLGAFFYGLIGRALNAFGLHHIFYIPLWQTALGGTMEVNGVLVSGTQNIFFAQLADPNTVRFSYEATKYMTGGFPVMMFGLPAAAFAMYQLAAPENKKMVGSILFSAAATSFLTGITEPLEFTFLFVAPFLYIIHAFLEGISYALMYFFQVAAGVTFSRGIIDLTLFGILQGNAKTNWLMILPIGLIYAFLYYGIFYYLIKRFNLKTPGRESNSSDEIKLYARSDYKEKKPQSDTKKIESNNQKPDANDLPKQILAALGGQENIQIVDACITRLRVTVEDQSKIISDQDWLELGASGTIRQGNGIQVIYGPRANNLKEKILKLMSEQ